MTDVPCPVPRVGEALAPWIHSRQETQHIRQSISQYLSGFTEGGHIHDPLLDCVSPSITLSDAPASLGGLHRHYYEALRANIAARENYQRVKLELQELKAEQAPELSAHKAETIQGSVKSYIKRQSQRRKHARLNIVQDTLAALTDQAPQTLHDELGAVVREEAGEAPDAPKTSLSGADSNDQVKELMFRLKRSILLAKHASEKKTQRHRNGHVNGDSGIQPSAAAQLQALLVARTQLIAWIEGELAKISEGEGDSSMLDADADIASEASKTTSPTEEEMLQQMQSLYDNYVAARQRLVRNIDGALDSSKHSSAANAKPADKSAVAPTNTKSALSNNITHADLVTAVPALVQTAAAERALVQQASYLRRQLNAASEETKATVQRLAGESYLVSSDATNMKAWAVAAAAKGEETDTFVRNRLTAGQTAVDATVARLSEVNRRARALGQLNGGL